jgi:molecular chaperone GrpE
MMVSIEQLDAANAQAKQYMDGWQRERAEFANYKRRTERERAETYQNASADVIKVLLPIIDDFERAMLNVPADLAGNPWVSGVGMVGRKFDRLLENFNVTAVDPRGAIFDPSLHEAISMEDAPDSESGVVIETLQRGYLVGERVLRPALVRVAR